MTAGESRDTPGGSGSYDQSVIPNCVHRDEEPRVSQDRPCFEKPKVIVNGKVRFNLLIIRVWVEVPVMTLVSLSKMLY